MSLLVILIVFVALLILAAIVFRTVQHPEGRWIALLIGVIAVGWLIWQVTERSGSDLDMLAPLLLASRLRSQRSSVA